MKYTLFLAAIAASAGLLATSCSDGEATDGGRDAAVDDASDGASDVTSADAGGADATTTADAAGGSDTLTAADTAARADATDATSGDALDSAPSIDAERLDAEVADGPSTDATNGEDDAANGDASDAANGDASGDANGDASGDASDTASGDAADAASAEASADAASADAATDAPASNDPFDFASCSEPALSSAEMTSLLGGAIRLKLADATLMRRTRSCPGGDAGACGAWSTPIVHSQALLTYSGGVTTDYKTFTFPTHLVLFTQTGQPRFSVRHVSDYLHDATASARGVVFAPGADPMVNTYPIIYVWDTNPAPYRYEDLQGLLGDDGYLHAALHCARVIFKSGLTTEIAALYRY